MSYQISIRRTDSKNPDFLSLVEELDQELAVTDGDDHAFYDQFNKLDHIKNAVVLYQEDTPVGCGALKKYEGDVAEIKRMYVKKQNRGKGYASLILIELEKWAQEMSFTKCILETGINQPEAIRLYKRNGYSSIPNYGQYKGVDKSFCFEKTFKR